MLNTTYASHRAGQETEELGRRSLFASAIVVLAVGITRDVSAGEHPTHTVALALVALVAAGLRLGLDGRRDGVVPMASAAVVAQLMLHPTTGLDQSDAVHHVSGGLLHVVETDGLGVATQVAVSAAVVVAVVMSERISLVLLIALCRPARLLLASGPLPASSARVPAGSRALHPGSMLRRCGWSIQAARRGPPHLRLA